MNHGTPLILSFEGMSVADANRAADDLRTQLLDADEGMVVNRQRDNLESQDFGATLSIVLAAPAVVAMVRAVQAWAVRKNVGSIVIRTAGGEILVHGLESKEMPSAVKAITGALESMRGDSGK